MLVLPDGSRSLIPASWTDLDPSTFSNSTASAATIATIPHLLQARKVVDALLHKLDDSAQQAPVFSKEEKKRASTISPVASRKLPPARHLARSPFRKQKYAHRCPSQTDRKSSLSPKNHSNPGGQP